MNCASTSSNVRTTVKIAKGKGRIKRDHDTVRVSSFLLRFFCSRLRNVCNIVAAIVKAIQSIVRNLQHQEELS